MESTLELRVHPLVLLNISDHYVRMRASAKQQAGVVVVGVLAGEQHGRVLSIENTFECTVSENALDGDFFTQRRDLFRQVFPDLDPVGWYITSPNALTEQHYALSKSFAALSGVEAPLLLVLDPAVSSAVKTLPVWLYELRVHAAGAAGAAAKYEPVSFAMEASLSEGVAVSHISKNTDDNAQNVALKLHSYLSGLHSATSMLGERLRTVIDYLAEVKKGNVKPTRAVLRQMAALCRRLPVLDSDTFQKDHMAEYTDGVLLGYLALLTRATQSLSSVVDKFTVTNDRQSMSRRRAGF